MPHIDLERKILDKNDRIAEENRHTLDAAGVYLLNILASPGSGKTSTIVATIEALRGRYRMAVIEGDIASDVDSQTIKALGIPAVQINTAGTCHLEADMLRRALDALDLDALDLVFVENVGNLVCPADFNLGENAKAMILSVPEGDDKPLKYPGMFQVASAIILNKTDVMSAFTFDKRHFDEHIAELNPQAATFALSATEGSGVQEWAEWLAGQVEGFRTGIGR